MVPLGKTAELLVQVIETFRAFLKPLVGEDAAKWTSGPIEIDYDALLPSSRHNIARSVRACTEAMQSVRDGLADWGKRARASRNAAGTGAGPGVAGETRAGLAGEFDREVRLRAVTPTRQMMKSSVGREVSRAPREAVGSRLMLAALVLLPACDSSLLDAPDDSRARASASDKVAQRRPR